MADYLFVSQSMIDGWLMEGKIDFSGNIMSIRGEDKLYKVEPAVRFVRVAGDQPDSEGLVAKVRTLEQVAHDGGEHYLDSVIFGDVAYDVQNGFVATVHVPEDEAVASKAPARMEQQDDAQDSKVRDGGGGPTNESEHLASADSRQEERGDEATDREIDEESDEESDEILLTRFLLKNLR